MEPELIVYQYDGATAKFVIYSGCLCAPEVNYVCYECSYEGEEYIQLLVTDLLEK